MVRLRPVDGLGGDTRQPKLLSADTHLRRQSTDGRSHVQAGGKRVHVQPPDTRTRLHSSDVRSHTRRRGNQSGEPCDTWPSPPSVYSLPSSTARQQVVPGDTFSHLPHAVVCSVVDKGVAKEAPRQQGLSLTSNEAGVEAVINKTSDGNVRGALVSRVEVRSEENVPVEGCSSSSWLSSDALCLLFCCRREPREEGAAAQESAGMTVYKVRYNARRHSHLVHALLLRPEDEDEEDVGDAGVDDVSNTLKVLTAKLEDLRTCHDLIIKHGAALQKSLGELEALDNTHDLTAKTKTVNERATLFRISSNAMINACNDYVEVSSTAGRKWQRLLQHERDQRVRLEDMVEQLARQHSHLEQEAKEQMNQAMPPGHSHSEDEEENEFEDAVEELAENFIVHVNTSQAHRRSNSNVSQASEGQGIGDTVSASSSEGDGQDNTVQVIMRKDNNTDSSYSLSEEMASLNGSQATTPTENEMKQANGRPKRQRRSRVPEKPNYPINLWSIMKNCIGKELSKIPMPVNFSEPLSFLQRLTEDFEYSDILDRASQAEDTCEQLSLVAAFTVSSYATTAVRTAKPFNPLLGETYECDRTDDLGWRAISEQVSHHPPIVAQYVEGSTGWSSWQEFSMSSKFRGKYLQIIPLGIAHLHFNNSGNHYTWRKVSTTVHNMIVGKLWLDNHGEMEIINHKTGDKCCLKFIPYSYFSRETPKKVTGYVVDSEGTFKWFITGMWDEKIEACRVTSQSIRAGKPVYETGPPKVLWKRNTVTPDAEKFYNFTELACQLNEPEENVCPTDSRNRPDQRLMEDGRWDEANSEKLRLEEKQRATRRRREAEAEEAATEGREYPAYSPTWFTKETDESTGALVFRYTHEYWDCKDRQDWSRCPDIF
ncbi:oxysterol-binding protein 1-like isoform X2 [Homarus americanus]|uniref:oxysterol-binding protein 1-like isoform X2 n=1 Tax=Homarus americanus TaxID=6706 RepID=UPI001C46B5B4|nr:oxysterol-binding protein 1-like isoform X2 [Homarus americanus]